jgi:hypothetical protein
MRTGKPISPACRARTLRVLVLAQIARHHGNAGLLHQPLGFVLQAHGPDGLRRRPDEGDAGSRAGFGELRVLRQEAVARVDAVRARLPCHGKNALGIEVALVDGSRTDEIRLVRLAHMHGPRFGLGMHRDDAQPHPPGGAGDAAGDLAAVGDEDGGEHRLLCHRRAPGHKRHRAAVPR